MVQFVVSYFLVKDLYKAQNIDDLYIYIISRIYRNDAQNGRHDARIGLLPRMERKDLDLRY